MPTVIDSLVVQFSLDASQFTRGQQEVLNDVKKMEEEAARASTETEVSTRKMSEVFTTLKREMLGFVGLALGGAEARRFFDFLVNLDASTSRLSRTLGINVSELSAWQNAAKAFGGTGQEVTGTIMKLEQEVWNFRFGAGSNLPGQLRALGGIDVFDNDRNPKNGIQLIREMADAVERLKMPTAGKAAFMRMLGIDETTINMVIRGRAELEKTLETMRRAGGTTAESGEAAEKYQAATARLSTSLTNLGRTFTPIINFLATMTDLSTKLVQLWSRLGFLPDARTAFAGDPNMADARSRLAAGLAAQGGAAPAAGGGNSNMTNFLAGLSFLETSQTGAGNSGSTAQGFFQFLRGTAAKARAAGIADPRFGNYQNQADRTKRYIEKFYPSAAAAIEAGDFKTAMGMLNKEWPSLPGGSQPQSAARYATFNKELTGGGPRPPGSVVVQNMNVYSRADDAPGIAKDIRSELGRTGFTAQVPQGTQ